MSRRGLDGETRRSPSPQLSAAIVGAQKAGTTSLLRYLSQHPRLCGHPVTEFTFFHDSEYRLGWDQARARYFYDHVPGQLLVAKHATLTEPEDQLARLAEHSPGCRIIFIVRDPVDRAFSSYRMERNHGSVVRPFEDILSRLDAEPDDTWRRLFVDFGDYGAGLRRIYRYFDPARVTVLAFEEFVADPVTACQRIMAELSVDAEFTPDTSVVHNPHRTVRSQMAASGLRWLRRPSNRIRIAARRLLSPRTFNRIGQGLVEANHGVYSEATIDPAVRDALARYYRPLNQDLEQLLGRDLSFWSGMTRAREPRPSAQDVSACR
jgi:hypothetical protein